MSFRFAAVAALVLAATSAAQAAPVAFDMGFDPIGSSGTGWTLPANIVHAWDSGRGATTPSADNSPSGYDFYYDSGVFGTGTAYRVTAVGSSLVAGDYVVTLSAASTWANKPTLPDLRVVATGSTSGIELVNYGVVPAANSGSYGGNWGSYSFGFTVPEGSAAVGDSLKLSFSSDNGGSSAVDGGNGFIVMTSFAATVDAVPEPSCIVILGLGSLLAIRRRQA